MRQFEETSQDVMGPKSKVQKGVIITKVILPVLSTFQLQDLIFINTRQIIIIALLWKSGGYSGFALSLRDSVVLSFRNLSDQKILGTLWAQLFL